MGETTTRPERYGVDFMWESEGKVYGVQRKTVSDLIASAGDGRLAKEIQQSKAIDCTWLLVEGSPSFTTRGLLVTSRRRGVDKRWTRASLMGLLVSVQLQGWMVYPEYTNGPHETMEAIEILAAWSEKPEHNSLVRRPARKREWGTDPTDRDWGIHVLQSSHGVGPAVAGRIFDHFGGLPMRLTCTEAQLLEVDGVGPKTAKAIYRAFNGSADSEHVAESEGGEVQLVRQRRRKRRAR